MASKGFLKPKVSDPTKLRKQKNGQFINPPVYMELGGFSESGKLKRTKAAGDMSLERGGPSARGGKPI